jgi:hypothetical protein
LTTTWQYYFSVLLRIIELEMNGWSLIIRKKMTSSFVEELVEIAEETLLIN